MPWVDLRCTACGFVICNHKFSALYGAAASAPDCQVCRRRMTVIAAIGRMDAGATKGAGFQAFSVTRLVPTPEGPKQVVEVIDSLHKLRAVEKDSEQRYRDGEGEPLRFRAWAQDRSNKDENAFGSSGTIGEQTYGEGEKLVKGGRVGVKRHGEDEPDVPIGPGMKDAYTPL